MSNLFRILLWVFAAIGLLGTTVTTMLALDFYDIVVAGAEPPDTSLGSTIAQHLRSGAAVPLQSIGDGGWTKACLVRPYLWSEAERLAGIERPIWWENEGVATLMLADDHGHTLYVPFLRSDMDIAEKSRYCAVISGNLRLVSTDTKSDPLLVRLE
jgi:hypothetical protein